MLWDISWSKFELLFLSQIISNVTPLLPLNILDSISSNLWGVSTLGKKLSAFA